MRHQENVSQLADWMATSLRWLILFSVIWALAVGGRLSPIATVILFAAAIWNIFLTILAALNKHFSAQFFIIVFVDFVIAILLFTFSGILGGNIAWVGLLPLISAAIYFGPRGALIITAANLGVQGLLAYFFNSSAVAFVFLATLIPLYLILGLVMGYLSQRMFQIAGGSQRSQQNQRREMERQERERRSVLYKLVSTLNATLNYQRVLETALDLSSSALGVSDEENTMVSGVLLYSAGESGATELHVGTARRFTSADLRISLPGTSGLIGRAIDDGEGRIAKEPAKDPELGRIVALRSCQAAYCVPLRSGLDTYGVLLFGHPDENYFTQSQREVLDVIANQSVIAIQNARLYHDLELEKERMTEIQEDARKKLARDLHDGPTQSVAAIAMRVNFARRLMERDAKAAAEELYKVEDLARRTTKEIRHMLFTLRPLVLESQGLIAALESMAEKMHDTYNQNVTVSADPEIVSQIEMGKQGVIFYIAEEAVNNARKHADAAHVWVRLKPAGKDLALLEIEDDGVGFEVNNVNQNYDKRGSLGMVNMRERAELVNGYLRVDSVQGKGTHISLVIPLTEEAAERFRRGL